MFKLHPKNIDIVVGICTKNCEDTIANVIKTVDLGLRKFFPKKKSFIFVSDISSDRTEQKAKSVKTSSNFLFKKQFGVQGKGNGVKTIFLFARHVNAKAIALVDGDLTSIKPSWINSLVNPILAGNDLAVPFYKRHKYDSVITNHLCFPLVSSLYGMKIRQPIGGEFGLSRRFFEKLLRHQMFPENFGIDIFITTTAIVEGMKIVETRLGSKLHASTKQYSNFETQLIPMYNQLVKTMLDLTFYNKEFLKGTSEIKSVKRVGRGVKNNGNNNFHVNVKDLLERFRREYGIIKNSHYLSRKTKSKLDYAVNNGCIVPIDTWADCVYEIISHYTENKVKVLQTLRTLWIGRYASFLRETENKNEEEAEKIIESQIDVFARKGNGFLECL